MDSLGRFTAILLAIIMTIMLPLQYTAQMHDTNINSYVEERTSEFAHNIRNNGYITKENYEEYVDSINKTGMYYDVIMEISHPVTGYDISANEDYESFMKTLNDKSLKASLIDNVIDDINLKRVSTNNIQPFVTHTHTDDCYAGYLHVCDNINCEYENSISREIILNVRVKENKTWGTNQYYNYLLFSEDNGETWVKKTSINEEYLYSQRIAYGPDGYYYYLSPYPYLMDYENYAPQVIRYNPRTNSKTVLTMLRTYNNISRYNELIIQNNKYFITPKFESYILHSSDGVNFATGSYLGRNTVINNIVYGKGKYVAAGYQSDNGNNLVVIFTSLDGVIWEKQSINSSSANIIFTGEFFIVGTSSGKIYSSSDGTNWTNTGRINGDATSLAYGNNMLIINSNGTHISEDYGKTFTKYNSNMMNINPIYYFDGFFYMTTHDANLRSVFNKSIDGVNWTSTALPVLSSNSNHSTSTVSITFNGDNDLGMIDRGPCLKAGKYYDSNGNEVFPICDQVVTSIIATNPDQTVKKGEPIITTAIATYLDGHTDIVNCSSNFNPDIVGNQTVTLNYIGLVGNAKTTGTITCTINVTVIPNKVLTSITVSPVSQSIPRYTFPTFTVTAYYDDGSNEILDSTDYNISGFNSINLGEQTVIISYTENEITKTAVVTVEVTPMKIKCYICGYEYEIAPDNKDTGCPVCDITLMNIIASPTYVLHEKGEELPIVVTAIYRSGRTEVVSGWTHNYDENLIGVQDVTITYKDKTTIISVDTIEKKYICAICGNKYSANEDGTDPGCPICKSTVVSINANPKEIIMKINNPIPITVTATFRDGHTEEVNGWTSNLPSGEIGTFSVVIQYQDVQDIISVTVIDEGYLTCPICNTIYRFKDSPRGCPECSVTVIGIEAELRNGGTKVLKGADLKLQVSLIYRDQHREIINEGWSYSGYNSHILGIQIVTVSYQEFNTSIKIEVIESYTVIICPNGHEYFLEEGETDTGCPYCNNEAALNESIFYIDITYNYEIIERLYSDEIIYLSKGDYISIKVTKNPRSYMNKLMSLFIKTKNPNEDTFIYGGEVL